MKLWDETMRVPEKEQKLIQELRKKNIVPSYTGFYMREKACPRENYLGSPENRRAAGFSIRDD
ncbi:MAG: hypothetical protein IJE68_00075 [Clostridia bacterium]|nr:hypothetical protein [Clostridia bacterium]